MRRISIYIILATLLFCACGETEEAKRMRTKTEQEKLRAEYESTFKIGVMPTLDCLPVFLLKDSLFYDSTKVDIRLKMFNAQMDCDTALIGGSVQGSVTDIVRAERLITKGTSVSPEIATSAYWQLIANKKSRLKDLSQLSDKMVAMTRYSATNMLTDLVVKRGKTRYPLYQVQINNLFIRLEMLKNNEIDAVWLTEPQATQARCLGNNVLMDTQKELMQLGVFAFRDKDISQPKRAKELEAFKRAYDNACDSINKYGIKHYSPLIEKYMSVDKETIKKLPNIKFEHSARPKFADVDTARKWLRNSKK